MGASSTTPIKPAEGVELKRFCQRWYVVACTPLSLDRECVNATEEYELQTDGITVKTTYTFWRRGEKEPHVLRPTGFVGAKSNAEWQLQFVWPIRAQYLIAYVAPDYSTCIVARDRRDLVWIMASTPTVPKDTYEELLGKVRAMGYDLAKVKLYQVPQGVKMD